MAPSSTIEMPVILVSCLSVLSAVGVALMIRDCHNAVPQWVRNSFRNSREEQRYSLLTNSGNNSHDNDEEERTTLTGSTGKSQTDIHNTSNEERHDMSSLKAISSKLERLFNVMDEKLAKDKTNFSVFHPFLAFVQLFAQFKDRHPDERQKQYEACGRPGTKADAEELGFRFELADWAYILDKDALAANLTEHGYKLLRHDITALPGYLGHYIALHSGSKKCVIGVKGTSNLEDMLTDCCGLGVEETLQDGTKIYCHEGIYISAKRLADDIEEFVRDLILPAGYHLELVGHSLGAGGAALLALILQSRITALTERGQSIFSAGSRNQKIRVWAFASPPVLDYQTAKSCAAYVTTIVNNADIIPRSSLSNLVVMMDILKDISKRLDDKGLDPTSSATEAMSFVKKISQGTEGDLLMTIDEFEALATRANQSEPLNDPTHMVCPGKVVTMYDDWTKDDSDEQKTADEDTGEVETPTAIGFVVTEDVGTARVLKLIEWNERMISDHFSEDYRSSIQSVTNLVS